MHLGIILGKIELFLVGYVVFFEFIVCLSAADYLEVIVRVASDRVPVVVAFDVLVELDIHDVDVEYVDQVIHVDHVIEFLLISILHRLLFACSGLDQTLECLVKLKVSNQCLLDGLYVIFFEVEQSNHYLLLDVRHD